jgi:hypothetical protein
MVKAARSDSLVERVDQLADVYGEVLLGLYDELTDQRERTEAVSSRADSVLAEARRLMDDMGNVANQARAIERQAAAAAAAVPAPSAAPAAAPDAATLARVDDALTRLAALEASAAALQQSVEERADAAAARSEALTAGLSTELRAHVQQSVADVRTEMRQTVTELRQHVRELVETMSREAQEAAARQTEPAAAAGTTTAAMPDTSTIIEEVRREASSVIADQVRRQAADSVAEELQRQRQTTPLAPPQSAPAFDDAAREQIVAQLRAEIGARATTVGAGAQRAEELSGRLEQIVNEAQAQLQDAKSDRAAAAFALRESRAELDAAKRALDLSDYTFTLDRLRRTEMMLYGTAVVAVIAIALALWALFK